MSDLFVQAYNPDVLSCLANLSNDEVFTPPEVANQMLDMLPEEIWSDPDATFLDPASKSGVFLREIAKRLIVGLEDEIPDLEERLENIFKKQVFGIATTELCSLLSRRSLYCSKYPNCEYSVVEFDDVEGNIRYRQLAHKWVNKRCKFCGASEDNYNREEHLESHAYEFIHLDDAEKVLPMKFDVIVANPPYHLETAGAGKQAKPIYNLFVEQAKKLNPRYLVMIMPSRWFAGGMGLDNFRTTMMNDSHITKLVDYSNAKDCFPQNSVGGGVCYFLRERDVKAPCEFTNINGSFKSTTIRKLNEFPVLVRYNIGVDIIKKVNSKHEKCLDSLCSSLMPYGLSTNVRGTHSRNSIDDFRLFASGESVTYIPKEKVSKGLDTANLYKIFISKTSAEHAGEPSKHGDYRVITSSMKVVRPGDICTHSYFVIGANENEAVVQNIYSYLRTRFVRFLMLMAMSSINLSKYVFIFVPIQDFSKPWTDEELYEKYGFTKEERAFIDSMIRPMGSDDAN